MKTIEHTVTVNVPVRRAYSQWTQFEDCQLFMEGVKAVRQLDHKRLQWKAEIGGQTKEWDGETHGREVQGAPTSSEHFAQDQRHPVQSAFFKQTPNGRMEVPTCHGPHGRWYGPNRTPMNASVTSGRIDAGAQIRFL